MLTVNWHGQTLHLLPERAMLWSRPSSTVLIVADLHLGKSATFRAAGIPVPEVIDADLAALTMLVARFTPNHLIIAGDLLHARAGRSSAVLDPFRRWREQHANLDIILVRGNHDRSAGDPPADLTIRVVNEPFTLDPADPIAFAHDPDPQPSRANPLPIIAGHLHPSISIGDGYTRLRAPCFWVRPRELILPARGRFTGTHTIRARRGDRVFAIGEGQVVEVRGSQPPEVDAQASTRAAAGAPA